MSRKIHPSHPDPIGLDGAEAELSHRKCAVENFDEANHLPMAFRKGSPMRPSYGVGHATVADRCLTMLKAFFEMLGGRNFVKREMKDANGKYDKAGKTMALKCLSIGRIAVLATSMAGCSIDYPQWDEAQSKPGARPVIEKESFQEIDLALILDPEAGVCKENCKDSPSPQQTLQKAFNAFYDSAKEQYALRRDRVQDRIIASSNQRCAEHKRFLRRFDTSTNMGLGLLTIAFGGAGSIFTSADAARALSGLAAVSKGAQSQVNEVYFSQQMVHVLVRGFEARRKEIFDKILEDRKEAEAKDYTVERAVGDAIRYHDACSVVAGLDQLGVDQTRNIDIGLDTLEETLSKLRESIDQQLTGPENGPEEDDEE